MSPFLSQRTKGLASVSPLSAVVLQGRQPTRSRQMVSKPTKKLKPSGALDQYAAGVADFLTELWNGAADGLNRRPFADQVIWHDSLLPRRDVVGQRQVQSLVAALRTALPDLRLTFQRPLLTGEAGVVLGYWTATGTHSGHLGPSLPPTGATAAWEGSCVIRTQPLAPPPPSPLPPPPQQQQPEDKTEEEEEQEQHRTNASDGAAAAAEVGLLGVEVWWSWDPVFLFRQLGWELRPAAETEAAEAEAASDAAAVTGVEDGGHLELATRTAAEARAAYGTEKEAAAAAAAAVATAAEAAGRLPAAAEGSVAGEVDDGLAAVQAANRAVVELYFHTYNTGNYEVLDHIVHPDYHYDGLLDLGERRGRAAMAAMMGGWRDCLPDLAIGHELFVAVGRDRVTFRWVIQGTHSTPGSKLLGVPAAGAPLLVKGVTTLTLRDGRICRKISHANAADTLRQLGAAVPPVLPLNLDLDLDPPGTAAAAAPVATGAGEQVEGAVQEQPAAA